jgi:thiamine biosynthesis lipoprotein
VQFAEGRLSRGRALLGTLVSISVSCRHRDQARALAAVEQAFEEIAILHRLLSRQEAGRDYLRLARARPGERVRVDPRTVEVLALALDWRLRSDGRFEPERMSRRCNGDTNGSRGGPAWRVEPPDAVHVLRRTRPDLDGIAKGYAVDRACEILLRHGFNGSVNAGGDLRCAEDQTIPLLLRSALAPGRCWQAGSLGRGAVATSETCVSRQLRGTLAGDGVRDRRRDVALPPMTVSVVAADCATADALTKVVAVDTEAAPGLVESHGATAWLFTTRGDGAAWIRLGAHEGDKILAA